MGQIVMNRQKTKTLKNSRPELSLNHIDDNKAKSTFLDLFCGCGGLSLGMQRAGLIEVAAIDSSPEAIMVFQRNFPNVPHVLERDLTQFAPSELASLIGLNHVDVVIGGPPCQGFSKVRQV